MPYLLTSDKEPRNLREALMLIEVYDVDGVRVPLSFRLDNEFETRTGNNSVKLSKGLPLNSPYVILERFPMGVTLQTHAKNYLTQRITRLYYRQESYLEDYTNETGLEALKIDLIKLEEYVTKPLEDSVYLKGQGFSYAGHLDAITLTTTKAKQGYVDFRESFFLA